MKRHVKLVYLSDLWNSDPKLFFILIVIYRAGRAGKGIPPGYPCSVLGLMLSPVQTVNIAELCHSGQAVMPRRHSHVCRSLIDADRARTTTVATVRGR